MIKKNKGKSEFTHFINIPFIREAQKQKVSLLQKYITQQMQQKNLHKNVSANSADLLHITLQMLYLPDLQTREQARELFYGVGEELRNILHNLRLTAGRLRYFTTYNQWGPRKITVIYLDFEEDEHYEKLKVALDYHVRLMLKKGIVSDEELQEMYIVYNEKKEVFEMEKLHLTLFWCSDLYEDEKFLEVFKKIESRFKGEQLECDWVDISTRWHYDETKYFLPLCRIRINDQPKK